MNKCTNLRISLRELSDITNNKFSSVIYDYVAFGNGNMVIFDVEAWIKTVPFKIGLMDAIPKLIRNYD